MIYFKVSLATDENAIGKAGFPQCKGIPSNMGLTKEWFDRPQSFTHLTNQKFPSFEPDFLFELEDKAYLTDVVSPSNISAQGYLVNEKAKELFSQFNIMEHKIYPAILIADGFKLNYFWIHFKENHDYFMENIDYNKSTFHIRNMAFMKIEDVSINSYQEYLEKAKELPFSRQISATHLTFSDDFNAKEYDWFYMNSLFLNPRISQRFKEAINIHKVTGLSITEQNIV